MENIEKMLAELPVNNIVIAFKVGDKTHTITKCDSWSKALTLTLCAMQGIIESKKDDVDLLNLSGLLHGAIEEIIDDVRGESNDAE